MDAASRVPTIGDVRAAAARLKGHAIRTPLLRSRFLDELTGASVYLKAETLQVTGSFKFRGAYNALSAMSAEERARGVVAMSSGNHAQGVAEAARLLGARATIVMPSDAPAIKIARTRRSGAEIVFYDRASESRDEVAGRVLSETGGSLVHPYDNPFVIAGQGTCGLEIVEDLDQMGIRPDRVFVCTGGGGLTAGIALAVSDAHPRAAIHSCEPVGFDDYRRSLEAGERLSNDRTAGSICDAIVTPSPGALGFEINRARLAGGVAVTDREALAAVAFAFNELKLVVEPGGAVALASVLQAGSKLAGETVVATLSGGNIDPPVLMQALSGS